MNFFFCYKKERLSFLSPVFSVHKMIFFAGLFAVMIPCVLIQSAFANANEGAELFNGRSLSEQSSFEESADTKGVMIAVIPNEVYLSESWRKRAAKFCTSNSSGLIVCEDLGVSELLLSQVKSEAISDESTKERTEQSSKNILAENRGYHLLLIFLVSMVVGSAISIYFAERNCPGRRYLAEKYGNQKQR